MRLSTALRIVTLIIVAKAVLIGVVYWRRAEILGRPIHIGADSWIGLVTIIATGLAVAAGIYVAARHYSLKT
jgi:acetyltransferase-like isoleucine patch superfamily enzyme